ncbi:HNH endonuclease signature motif containing protein [Sorangium sp. So ce260]|uniref:HNH endonuclease signature motif containing protein n=1 Tax=Sorangium sp. So ce260 TaxID=3133291 RepID=UPI003F6126D2
MKLNEAASLLAMSKERVLLAIEEGIETPKTKTRVRLRAVSLQHGHDIAQEDLDAFIRVFESEEPGRHPPVAVRRTLLIEARYKCAICRENGPIEFHHVIEWTTVSHHDPQHMLAVCSNCHARITRFGEPDVLAQRQIKKNLQERQAASEPTPEFVDPAPPLPSPAPTAPQESNFADVFAMTSPTTDAPTPPPVLKTPARAEQSRLARSFEQTMRQIFVQEITYAGPSSPELEWVGALLFGAYPRNDADCILLLRTARAIFQIQRITRPDATWTNWAYTSRIIEATANVLAELDYNLDTLNGTSEKALRIVRERRYLQFKDEDEWRPGMASGTGWVEYAALSLIGEKLLKKTDAQGAHSHGG